MMVVMMVMVVLMMMVVMMVMLNWLFVSYGCLGPGKRAI